LITQKHIEEFQTNGAVLLKGMFKDYVDTAREAIEENKAKPSWRERTYNPDDGSAPFFQDYVVWNQCNSIKTPWHQDQPYYLVEGEQTVSFWVPLDPIPRDRTIEYIAGSNRWNKDFRPDRFDGTPLFADDTSEAVPDVDANRDSLDVIGWAVEPAFSPSPSKPSTVHQQIHQTSEDESSQSDG